VPRALPGAHRLLDCLTCHPATETDSQHGPVGGYARDSSLCVRCHAESQVHRVSTHLPFNIRAGPKHYRSSCLTCHPSSRTDKAWAQDFTPFVCLSCHTRGPMDDKHQNFSTYRYVSTTCVNSGCHQNGSKP
jgi:predicted metal-binding protein